MLTRRGSLQVTKARLPARFEIMRCAPERSCCSLGSVAKSDLWVNNEQGWWVEG